MEMQVIGITQQNLRAEREQILMCKSLHRSGSSHGHEEWCFDDAVSSFDAPSTTEACGMEKSKSRRHIYRLQVAGCKVHLQPATCNLQQIA